MHTTVTRKGTLWFSTILLFFMQAVSFATSAEVTFDLKSFIAAVERNPAFNESDSQALLQAREAENRAGKLPNPELMFGRQNQPLGGSGMAAPDMGASTQSNTGSAPTWVLQATQSLPWPGALENQKHAAKAALALQDALRSQTRLERRFEAEALFLAMVSQNETLLAEKEALGQQVTLLRIVAARLPLGLATHHDLIQQEAEGDILVARIASLETEMLILKDEAGFLMGRTHSNGLLFSLERTEPTSPSRPSPPQPVANDPDLTRATLEARRRALTARLESESSAVKPMFAASGMLMREDSGSFMGGLMFGLSVPLYSGGLRNSFDTEKEIVLRGNALDLDLHERRKNLALTQNLRIHTRMTESISMLETRLLPNAQAHLTQLTSEYGQGRSDLTAVSQGRRSLLKLRRSLIALRARQADAALARKRIQAGDESALAPMTVPMLETAFDDMSMKSPNAMGQSSSMGKSSGMPARPKSNEGRRNKQKSAPPSQNSNAQESDTPQSPAGAPSGMGM